MPEFIYNDRKVLTPLSDSLRRYEPGELLDWKPITALKQGASMSNEHTVERTFVFTDTLESGGYLFRTEHGSLVTEDMVKAQLLAQFENARRKLDKATGKQRLRITMEVSNEEGQR